MARRTTTTFYCDICGKEHGAKDIAGVTELGTVILKRSNGSIGYGKTLEDVCMECYHTIEVTISKLQGKEYKC